MSTTRRWPSWVSSWTWWSASWTWRAPRVPCAIPWPTLSPSSGERLCLPRRCPGFPSRKGERWWVLPWGVRYVTLRGAVPCQYRVMMEGWDGGRVLLVCQRCVAKCYPVVWSTSSAQRWVAKRWSTLSVQSRELGGGVGGVLVCQRWVANRWSTMSVQSQRCWRTRGGSVCQWVALFSLLCWRCEATAAASLEKWTRWHTLPPTPHATTCK